MDIESFISTKFATPSYGEAKVVLEFGYQKYYGSQFEWERIIMEVPNTDHSIEDAMTRLRSTRSNYHYLRITAAYIQE